MQLIAASVLLLTSAQAFRPIPHSTQITKRQLTLSADNRRIRGEIASEYVPLEEYDWTDPLICDPDFPCAEDNGAGLFTTDDFLSVIGIPFLSPFVAFATFESTSNAYQSLVEYLSTRTWVAVDGGGTLCLF